MSEPHITAKNVDAWVAAAKNNPPEYSVRRVMRVILHGVASSSRLNSKLVFKGGALLALGYGTARHTKDLDFSTSRRVQEEDTDKILAELDNALTRARMVDEPVLCRVQSHKLQPPGAEANFPTLRIRVGYAFQGERQFRRMVQGRDSAQVVTIDLSFNEQTCIASSIALDNHEIMAYSLFDQIAEKYRAMIQQTSDLRDRARRQDVYDIFAVINRGYLATTADKEILLATIQQKFAARAVPCTRDVINEPEVAQRSRREYARLQDEIDGDLPDFGQAFDVVRDFFLSLPWHNKDQS